LSAADSNRTIGRGTERKSLRSISQVKEVV